MKKSDIEKQLKKDLKQSAPSDFSAVWARCEGIKKVPQERLATQTVGAGTSSTQGFSKKQILATLLSAFLLFAFCILSFSGGGLFTSRRFSVGSFLFDVNPSVEVSYDEKGVVTKVEGLNDDGKALLIGTAIVGHSYEEAMDVLMSRCVALGYFSASREDNALLTTASKEDGKKDEKMTAALKEAVAEEFSHHQLRGVVITGVSSPELVEAGKKYGVDGQKYGLIMSYLAIGGELEEVEYSTVSIRELYGKIEQKQAEIKAKEKQKTKEILKDIEIVLCKTLEEQIDLLVKTLDVVMPLGAENEDKLATLKTYAVELENVTTQIERKKVINQIKTELDRLQEAEESLLFKGIIKQAKSAIFSTYDFYEAALYQIIKLSASPEQVSAARLKKFQNHIGEVSQNYDAKAWQKAKEKEFSDNWYILKSSWETERKKDI